MKPIQAYQSFDGRVFVQAKDCADYESHCHNLSNIIRVLPKFDHTNSYDIGKSYYQHDKDSWLTVRNNLLLYLDQVWPALKIGGLVKNKAEMAIVANYDWMNKFLRKNCDMPSLLAWQMVGYVDNDFRQWSQPAYAMGVEKRTGKCLNPSPDYKDKTYNLDTIGLQECDVPTVKP